MRIESASNAHYRYCVNRPLEELFGCEDMPSLAVLDIPCTLFDTPFRYPLLNYTLEGQGIYTGKR